MKYTYTIIISLFSVLLLQASSGSLTEKTPDIMLEDITQAFFDALKESSPDTAPITHTFDSSHPLPGTLIKKEQIHFRIPNMTDSKQQELMVSYDRDGTFYVWDGTQRIVIQHCFLDAVLKKLKQRGQLDQFFAVGQRIVVSPSADGTYEIGCKGELKGGTDPTTIIVSMKFVFYLFATLTVITIMSSIIAPHSNITYALDSLIGGRQHRGIRHMHVTRETGTSRRQPPNLRRLNDLRR